MALSANRDPQVRDDKLLSLPVEDDVHIYRGALVCVNAAGYAVPAADTAGYSFRGVAIEEVDNTLTGHSQGGKRVRVRRRCSAVFAKASAVRGDNNEIAYVSDDETVVLAGMENNIAVGEVIDLVDSSHVRVQIN